MGKKIRIRECRQCKKRYRPPSLWAGCCSEECLILRLSFLKNRRQKKKKEIAEAAFDPTSRRWLELRYKTLKRYGWKCQCCGATPPTAVIQVDHILPKSKFPEKTWDPENLQVLCRECNYGKSDRDTTDFRPKEEFDLIGTANPCNWLKGK